MRWDLERSEAITVALYTVALFLLVLGGFALLGWATS